MRDFQDDDPVDRLRLIRSRRVGAVTFHRLVAEHGSVRAALAALPEVARAAGVEDYAPCPVEVARHEMAQARLAGARLIVPGDPFYPVALEGLPDAPPVLWAIGDVGLLKRPMVAVVGARNASSLGVRMARRLAAALGEAGQVVASGLARGIDAEAHAAALATGTVAVMAGGVDVIYPEENASLAARIAEGGCLLSEQPMGLQPQARHFPLRNRIIAGLARAVVVVEAAARSGSLITARDALDMGREVLAVPGHPFDARAAGCNMLIRDGAVLVRGADDVLEAIGAAGIGADAVELRAGAARASGDAAPAVAGVMHAAPVGSACVSEDGGGTDAGVVDEAGVGGHDMRLRSVRFVPSTADGTGPEGVAQVAVAQVAVGRGRAAQDAGVPDGVADDSGPREARAPDMGAREAALPGRGEQERGVRERGALERGARERGSGGGAMQDAGQKDGGGRGVQTVQRSAVAVDLRAGQTADAMQAGEASAGHVPMPQGQVSGPVPAARPLQEVAALHRMILDRLGPSAVAEDQLIRDLDLPTETVARELVALEVEGRVLRQAGGLLSRC